MEGNPQPSLGCIEHIDVSIRIKQTKQSLARNKPRS
jgi:hypothetical protein